MKKFLNRYFQIEKKGSTIGREVLAGAVVFLAMLYILPVNTSILSGQPMSMNANGVFIATAIVSGIATLIMGLIAKYPITLSAGMGMNAYIAFTVCGSLGYSWQEAMALIFVAGLLFFVMTLTPLRKLIIKAIPQDIKFIISAGLGCFIAFIGLKGAGIIEKNEGTLVGLGSLSNPTILLAMFGVLLVFGLMFVPNKMVKRLAIVISMFATALLGFILGLAGVGDMPHFVDLAKGDNWVGSLSDFKNVLFFGGEWNSLIDILLKPETYAVVFALVFVNIFDTTATLLAVGKGAGLIDKDGELIGGKKALLADAVGSVICAPLGTSTVTSFAESTIGIEVGGRTGLSAVTSGILFLLAIFISPIFSIFNPVESGLTPVTAMALVAVGALIFTNNLKDINWNDSIITITAFLTMIFMMLTYSLADGLGIGLIIYLIMMLASGRYKEIHPVLYGVAGFFVISFGVREFINAFAETKETNDSVEIVCLDAILSATKLFLS